MYSRMRFGNKRSRSDEGVARSQSGSVPHEARASRPNPIPNAPDVEIELSNKKKRVRGPTCMPKVWGQQPDKLVAVSFNDLGQPNDEDKTTTLSHFCGTIARNGRYCPLNYPDWRKMPQSYKDDMKMLVKARFDLPPGQDNYILQSINKKWRNWKSTLKSLNFDHNVPIEEQMLEIPKGVNEDQYKALVEHWFSDKSKKMSDKNKQTRAKLEFFHRMGKRSFAIVKEIMHEHLGRYPTRAELFEKCYYKPDGSPMSDAILEAIEKMKELASQTNDSSSENDVTPNEDDEFARVMGRDTGGRVRLYGLGVKASDVYGGKPSRATLERQNEEYKVNFKAMSEKLEELTSLVYARQHSNGQREVESNRNTSPSVDRSFRSPSPPSHNNHRPSASTSTPRVIRVGSYVVLKSFGNINEIIATGIVRKLDGVTSNGMDLGSEFCEVSIQCVLKADVKLFFAPGQMENMGHALGAPIPWPLSLVAWDENEN